MAVHRTCDGIKRRDLLKVGAVGATGLTLQNFLRWSEAGQTSHRRAEAAIFINLTGGPSHMDTFDLKPNSPDEYRGEFSPIATNVPGIEISEHLPKLAQCLDKFTILRGVTHSLGAHALGQQYVNTGSRPLPSLEYPGYGSVVAKELGGPAHLPPFVAIPNTNQKAGFLGVKYAPLRTGSTPKPGQSFGVRGIALSRGLTQGEVERRSHLLQDLDRTFHGYEADNQLLDGLDRFGQQAHAIISSKRAREAFDVSRESPEFASMFGATPFGQSCLLARRLVEAGVVLVQVTWTRIDGAMNNGTWDTHKQNATSLKEHLMPRLDRAYSALLEDLSQRGLLDETLVVWTGEFGRTPRINGDAGRDHWPHTQSILLGGAGISGGTVYGATDRHAAFPVADPVPPPDLGQTILHAVGVPEDRELQDPQGRPIPASYGSVNGQLLA